MRIDVVVRDEFDDEFDDEQCRIIPISIEVLSSMPRDAQKDLLYEAFLTGYKDLTDQDF